MEKLNLILTLLGGTVLVLALASRRLESSILPPTVLALVFGVLIGPEVGGLVDLPSLGSRRQIVEAVARITLGIGLVGVALRIPRAFPRRHGGEMALLIIVGMILMWAVSALLLHWILALPWLLAALVGAIITPTDPIAATPIVTGEVAERNLPDRLRHAISFESGANDGLSYLFVFLPSLLILLPTDEAMHHWLRKTLLWEVGVATAFGLVLGYASGHALKAAEQRGWVEQKWRLVYTVALALIATGAGRLIRSDELLVVFAAGAMFVQVVSEDDRANEEQGQEAMNRFFSVPFFVVLGLVLPWQEWARLGWSGVALAVAVLLLRRPVAILLMRPLLPSVRSRADALFVGWFGPIAVAAIYYASLMEHRMGEPRIWAITTLVVCASVLAHGMTAVPLTRLYGRRTGYADNRSQADTAAEKS